jgi:hypothetical protein
MFTYDPTVLDMGWFWGLGNDNNKKSELFSHVTNTYSFKESSF